MQQAFNRLDQCIGACVVTALLLSTFASHASAASIFDDNWTPPKRTVTVPVAPPATQSVEPPAAIPPASRPAAVAPSTTPITQSATQPATAPSPVVRHAIPAAADQAKSRKLLRDVYAKELSDRSIAGRAKLAEQLLAEAKRAADNPVDCYVLLGGAIQAATESANLTLCITAADAMANAYRVDPLAVKADAAITLKYSAAADKSEQNIRDGLTVLDDLLAAEDFPVASRLAAVLQKAATGNASLSLVVQRKADEATFQRTAHDRALPYVDKLKAAPADPAANLAVGRYLCFARDRWEAGLPMLKHSSDPALSTAAARDLSAPTDFDAQIAAGDAWWDGSEKEPPYAQLVIRRRAALLYNKALASGQVTGLSRTRLEKRIASIPIFVDAAAAGWISKNATYTASSISHDWGPLPNLLDGRGGGLVNNGLAFHTTTEPNPFIIIDLGASCVVTRMEIMNRQDNDQDRARTLTAWVSSDPAGPWQELWRAPQLDKQWEVKLEQPKQCRYVKLGLRETNAFHLFSVKIFGVKSQ